MPRTKTNLFKVGIEVESVINNKLLKIERGRYHNGLPIPGSTYWTTQSDSTISSDSECKFSNEHAQAIEFVSNVVKNKKEWKAMLDEFKNIISKKGKYELNKVIHFPISTGNHVHFSIKGFRFSNKYPFSFYKKVRQYFLKKVNASKIGSKELIVKHYFRGRYAGRLKRESLYGRDRYGEFNLDSEYHGAGLEWRSINLHHLKTWDEFYELMGIIWDSLVLLYNTTKSYKFKTYSLIPKLKQSKGKLESFKSEIKIEEEINTSINLTENKKNKKVDSYFGSITTIETISG